jgi:hypothetical protein
VAGGTDEIYGKARAGITPSDRTGVYNTQGYDQVDANFSLGEYAYSELTDDTAVLASSGRINNTLTNSYGPRTQVHWFHNTTGSSVWLTNRESWMLRIPNPVEVLPGRTNMVALHYANFDNGIESVEVRYAFGSTNAPAGGGGEPPGAEAWSGLDGMLAYYDMDDTSFSFLLDKHTGGLDLNTSSSSRFGSWTGGAPGGIDCVTNYVGAALGVAVQADTSLYLPDGGTRTYAFWVYKPNAEGTAQFMGRNATGTREWITTRTSSNFNVRYSSNGTTDIGGDTGIIFTLEEWHFVVVTTHDSVSGDSTGYMSYSIDGGALTVRHSNINIFNQSIPFTLFGFGAGTSEATRIAVAAGGIWDRELTQNEIEFLHNSGTAVRVYADFNAP